MRLPNGYGSVIKLKGKRRKPYAVRTSEISEFVEIDAPKEPPYISLSIGLSIMCYNILSR